MSLRRLVYSFLFFLLILPSTFADTGVAAVAGEWTAEEVRAILAERIDEHEKSVGIAIGLIDEHRSTVVGYGKLSTTDDRTPDGKTVFGEISQDCGRFRHFDLGSLDKDVWRSGGSSELVLEKWQLLLDLIS